MGIYDRDYYRREGPSFLGSITSTGQVCKWLIGINVAVFILQLVTAPRWEDRMLGARGPGWFTELFVLDIDAVLHGQVWRLLTYAFLHDFHWAHIVFNMLFLWWFGSDVEDLYGPREFLAFYLVSALLGGVAFVLGGVSHIQLGTRSLGASGAVTAAMVLYALHYPSKLILVWFFLPVPIWLFVLFQVAQDVFGLLGGEAGSRTAYTVHLAGAAFAFGYHQLHWRLSNLWPDLRSWRRQRSRPRLRVFQAEEEPVALAPQPVATAEADEHLEAKLDAVLDKVAKHGQASLTESERQILFRASEVYKRRRS